MAEHSSGPRSMARISTIIYSSCYQIVGPIHACTAARTTCRATTTTGHEECKSWPPVRSRELAMKGTQIC